MPESPAASGQSPRPSTHRPAPSRSRADGRHRRRRCPRHPGPLRDGAGCATDALGFPWATLWVNVIGSFVLGVVVTLVTERWPGDRWLRPLVAVGFCGGFTTFSTFAVEIDQRIRHGHATHGSRLPGGQPPGRVRGGARRDHPGPRPRGSSGWRSRRPRSRPAGRGRPADRDGHGGGASHDRPRAGGGRRDRRPAALRGRAGVRRRLGPSFPYGTLLINVTGSFLLGLLTGLVEHHGVDTGVVTVLGTGLLGRLHHVLDVLRRHRGPGRTGPGRGRHGQPRGQPGARPGGRRSRPGRRTRPLTAHPRTTRLSWASTGPGRHTTFME